MTTVPNSVLRYSAERTVYIPLDIASLRIAYREMGGTHALASPHHSYSILSYDLPRRLLSVVQDFPMADVTLRETAIASLYEIYLDMARLARALIDIGNIRRADAQPLFNPTESPVLNYLLRDTDGSPVSISEILPSQRGRLRNARSFKDQLRRLKSLALLSTTTRRNRHDIIATGGLVDQYLSEKDQRYINLNPYLLSWPVANPPSKTMQDLSEALCEIFDDIISRDGFAAPKSSVKATAAARILTLNWLSQSYAFALSLRRSTLNFRSGDVLIGTAPKNLGRLLGCFYQARNARVIRFSHGGERPFFDDYHWGLSELPYCDEYVTHSSGEASAIERRHRESRLLRTNKLPPTCTALGTHRHQKLFYKMHREKINVPTNRDRPRVMFLASSYLTEVAAHLPAIKPADVYLADLHLLILESLSSVGCEVFFKPHPKGLLHDTDLFTDSFDKLITGPFQPASYDVDAYIFDYAGSAFFDALASSQGVILIDTGLRPFDSTTFVDIEERCVLVPATQDHSNRFRINIDQLSSAIQHAVSSTGCSEFFAQKYFFPSENNK